jgi:hypothetical protein
MVEHLPSKCEVLSSTHSTVDKKRKKGTNLSNRLPNFSSYTGWQESDHLYFFSP